jgi:hypothetical protein
MSHIRSNRPGGKRTRLVLWRKVRCLQSWLYKLVLKGVNEHLDWQIIGGVYKKVLILV